VLSNRVTDHFEAHQEELKKFPEQLGLAYSSGTMHLGGDAVTEGVDVTRECYPAGQGVGAISELVPAAELVRRFVSEAEAALRRLAAIR
jgi:enoyl-[acyl-carrier protein] reductase II